LIINPCLYRQTRITASRIQQICSLIFVGLGHPGMEVERRDLESKLLMDGIIGGCAQGVWRWLTGSLPPASKYSPVPACMRWCWQATMYPGTSRPTSPSASAAFPTQAGCRATDEASFPRSTTASQRQTRNSTAASSNDHRDCAEHTLRKQTPFLSFAVDLFYSY
jgi:hypothetical protein